MSASTVISTLSGVVMSNELSIIAICIVYNIYHLVISAKEVMFLSASVCFSVCQLTG